MLGSRPCGWGTPDRAPAAQSWSRCRRRRARRGSTCRPACGTEPAAGGSPCSPTAEVRSRRWQVGGDAGQPVITQRGVCGAWVGPSAHGCLACSPHPADDNATIRVTNLSEDTRETDLQELFRPFGSISRIYLAKDKTTGQSKVCGHGCGLGRGASSTLAPPPDPCAVPRASRSSASTAGRMQPEPSLECPALVMTTSSSMWSGPSKPRPPVPHPLSPGLDEGPSPLTVTWPV